MPPSVLRPHYVDAPPGTPADYDDPLVKDADTIARMRVAGRIAADATAEVGRHVAPGITTDELDRIGHEYMVAHGAYPSTLGYKGYPKSICTSVNEVICHGIPDSRALEDGEIVKVDITAFIDGVHGDTCATFFAGDAAPDVRDLGERTREAMLRGIKAVQPGRPISVIGRVIESYAKRFGYGVVRDYTGHGVGQSFHTKPTVLHYDEPRARTILVPGMTFTIEPMLTLGGYEWEMWDDDWTVLTQDGSWVAQWEHTIAVTDDGAEILTLASR
ncbi:MAG: methionyl aminopeptidase [Pseudonocardiales bacterium]|nr:methionyl aminopeptidase [Pseudonocardiales bacterium]